MLSAKAMALCAAIRAPGRSPLPYRVLLRLCFTGFWLPGSAGLHAATISGTVKDPSGAVIAQARIEVRGGDLAQPVVFFSDGLGRFVSPDLKAGKYSLEATRDGFEPLVKPVDLQGPVELELFLAIARQQESISVPAKSLAFANSDPVYRQLRAIGLGTTFRFDHFTLNSDAAIFQFQKGTLTFLSPVEGVVTGAIFVGEGHCSLHAATPLDARELSRRTGGDGAEEDFSAIVFRFTRDARLKFTPGLGDPTSTPSAAEAAFDSWHVLERLRLNNQDQDKAFIAMMHDFVASHREPAASTESFRAIAEKHMTKSMDLARNGRLDWFFDSGCRQQVPRYHFEYQLNPAAGGK